MPDNYFSMFPQILYQDKTAVNISERVAIDVTHDPRLVPTIYYPYELKNEMRADVIASMYYENSNLDWLIYLTNGMTDPYYDWHLTDFDFNEYIIKKYGSVEYAQQLIAYYRVNWVDFDRDITISHYDALPPVIKKYFIPTWNQKAQIIGYKRREEDWIVNTNKVLLFNITLDNNKTFANNELIDIYDTGIITGHCQIVGQSNDGLGLYVHHVSGNTSSSFTLIGNTSNCYGTITQVTTLDEPLTADEFVYWQPVYFYDLEREKNEQNKTIYLIDANQALPVINNIRTKLNE